MKLGTAHPGGRDRSLGHVERRDVPGYTLLERLAGDGRDGVEVWKAEGPGGFPAALRFVRLHADGGEPDSDTAAAGPADATPGLDLLRRARHPNLLTAFGWWRVGGSLVVATDLPDGSLWDRFLDARADGALGIPRDELLDHLAEAARGLDSLNANGDAPTGPHGAVNPRTILFVGGGVKVSDRLAAPSPRSDPSVGYDAFFAPDYASPECLGGGPSRQADQYGLAVTYCHLRVGRLPFPTRAPGHDDRPPRRSPDLSALDPSERPAVARALAEAPDDRWPSCRAFVDALRASGTDVPAARTRVGRAASLTLAAAAGAAALAGVLFFVPRSALPNRPVGDPARVQARAAPSLPAPSAPPEVARNPAAPVRLSVPKTDTGPDPSPAPVGTEPRVATVAKGAATEPQEPVPPPPPPELPAPAEPAEALLAARAASPREEPEPPPASAPGPTAITTSLYVGPTATATEAADEEGKPEAVARPREEEAKTRVSPPTLHLEAPEALAVEAGRTVSLPVKVSCEGFDGPIEVRLQGLPRGLTASPGPGPGPEAEAKVADTAKSRAVRVEADADSAEGETLARLVATAGPSRAETAVRVVVRPGPSVAARRRGDAALRREEYGEAIAAYTQSITLDPSDALAFHGRALGYYGKGDHAAALADVGAALKLRPATPTALNNRGLIRMAQGDHAGAIADFDAAVGLDPTYAVVRYNRGRALADSGSTEPALAEFNEAIKLDRGFAKAYKARADVFTRQGDRPRALADYDEAVRLRPDDPAALNNRGLLRFALGEPHRAIADFDEAIRISPRYAVVRYNRGRVYASLGDTVEALTSFEQAIRLDPTLTRAVQARGEILNRPSASPAPNVAPATRPGPGLGVATRREPSAGPGPVPGPSRPPR